MEALPPPNPYTVKLSQSGANVKKAYTPVIGAAPLLGSHARADLSAAVRTGKFICPIGVPHKRFSSSGSNLKAPFLFWHCFSTHVFGQNDWLVQCIRFPPKVGTMLLPSLRSYQARQLPNKMSVFLPMSDQVAFRGILFTRMTALCPSISSPSERFSKIADDPTKAHRDRFTGSNLELNISMKGSNSLSRLTPRGHVVVDVVVVRFVQLNSLRQLAASQASTT
mmetsp:Transcript_26514/g.61881  ORF Transcript_26514/g.61881 Transcript_26514/m.61881 type:complete len:223 (-) Transcript_26514:381-1049(-)